MARDWEAWLRSSTGPASATETADRDRTVKRIRDAIAADDRLSSTTRVFVKGSYANNTNVRRDSDVDIAVEWRAWAFISRTNQAADQSWSQLGVSTVDSGPSPAEYRGWVEQALSTALGSSAVNPSGNKAIFVGGSSTTLDADVVPCFQHKRYDKPGREPHVGIRLYPRKGPAVENWPEQNRRNGNEKNEETGKRYKQLVRAIKRLENDMVEKGRLSQDVHGYFIECLLYNLPWRTFMSDSYKTTAKSLLASLWAAIKEDRHVDWVEVNRLKWLWRSGQTWTPEEASNFAYQAWNYIHSG